MEKKKGDESLSSVVSSPLFAHGRAALSHAPSLPLFLSPPHFLSLPPSPFPLCCLFAAALSSIHFSGFTLIHSSFILASFAPSYSADRHSLPNVITVTLALQFEGHLQGLVVATDKVLCPSATVLDRVVLAARNYRVLEELDPQEARLGGKGYHPTTDSSTIGHDT